MFTTIGFWSLVLNILVLIVSITGFLKIMKNDLSHLQESLEEIKILQKEHGEKILDLAERISCIEGKIK